MMSSALAFLVMSQDGDADFRTARARSLAAPQGWLSVSGLYWLREGSTTFGSSADQDIVFPTHSAPAQAGILVRRGRVVDLEAGFDAPFFVGSEQRTTVRMHPDPSPVRVALGSLTLSIIERGDRIGLRLYDDKARNRLNFRGLSWYPWRRDLVVNGRLVARPRTLQIANVLGMVNPSPSPGYVEFRLNGRTRRLTAEQAGQGLFFNFRDATSGSETYGAGRFLNTAGPDRQGRVVLDFNRAVNPPCAYTDYATCPLPPPENRLPLRIEAGERTFIR
jgi:uncharacterized protein (DUF1684 family)